MNYPQINTVVKIESLKHDGSFHRSWKENIILHADKDVIIGANHKTIVNEPNKKQWRTDDLAIVYFSKYHWFNIVILFKSESDYSFYCNMISPFTYDQGVIQYIDYDIDVIVHKDHSLQVVDVDEFDLNKQQMDYSSLIINKVNSELLILKSWINNSQNPFNEHFVANWYDRYANQ